MSGEDVAFNQAYWTGQTRSDVGIEKKASRTSGLQHRYQTHLVLTLHAFVHSIYDSITPKQWDKSFQSFSWGRFRQWLQVPYRKEAGSDRRAVLTEDRYSWLASFSYAGHLFYYSHGKILTDCYSNYFAIMPYLCIKNNPLLLSNTLQWNYYLRIFRLCRFGSKTQGLLHYNTSATRGWGG